MGGSQIKSPLFNDLVADLVGDLTSDKSNKPDPKYQKNPVAWLEDVLGIDRRTIVWSLNDYGPDFRWDGTPDPLLKVLESVANFRDVGVESATGTGKTFLGACLVLWFLAVFPRSIVVTTAPKEQQLTLHLWKEVGRLWPQFIKRYPDAIDLKLHLKMGGRSDWYAIGFACGVGAAEQSATRAQGFHAEYMLIITEETPGVPAAVMTAFENTCTGPCNVRVAFGNPDHTADPLHVFCTQPTTTHVRISALDHPNVVLDNASIVPGAVSRASIQKRAERYGVDSQIYMSRVRGICPEESSESLIKRSWARACVLDTDTPQGKARYEELRRLSGPARGVDVANSANGDKAAIARGEGAVCYEVVDFPCPDASVLADLVAVELGVSGVEEKRVGVDAVGVGASAINQLKRLGYHVTQLHGAGKVVYVQGAEEFGNIRAQMWWQARMDIQAGKVILPDDEELINELVAVQWEPRNGKIYVEEKLKIKDRLGWSPNKADAFVYWNWVRQNRFAATGASTTVAF